MTTFTDFDRSDFRDVHRAVYYETLVHDILKYLVAAASNGWGPEDIAHVLGDDIRGLLFRAAPRVPANVTNAALRKAWLRCPIASYHRLPLERVEQLLHDVARLGSLNDEELLAHVLSGDRDHDDVVPTDNLTDPQRKARQKVESLLRKSESTEFEDEANALIAKAQQLRQRYRLHDALNTDTTANDDTTVNVQDTKVVARRVHIDSPWVKHQATLLGAIAHANGCATLLLDDRGIATVIGTDDDVSHVYDLFASLNRQCAWFMDRGPNFELARRRRQTASYRRSFRLAYAARIGELLRRANAASQQAEGAADSATASATDSATAYDITSHALPVLARRQAQAEESRDRLFPHLGTISLSATNAQGMHDGHDAASKSRLGGDSQGVGGQRQIAS